MPILALAGKPINLPSYADLVSMYAPSPGSTFHVLIYGKSGSGKTRLAGTFPKPFFIDTDRGMRSLAGQYPRLQLQTSSKPFSMVLSVLQDALDNKGPWAPGGALADVQTIVIDSITSLVDEYMAPEVMAEANRSFINEKLSYDEYGKIKSRMSALASLIKDLAMTRYVVATALVDEEKDENSGVIVGKPLLTGKYRDKIEADYDETYYLEPSTSVTGPTKFMLYAQPYRWFKAKTRLTNIKSMDDPSFAKIVANFKPITAV